MSDLQITIGFSTTNRWRSRLIRWVTRSPCSHAWLAFEDHTLNLRLVMQAETWGYEVRPWNRWTRENILVSEFTPIGPSLEDSLQWIAVFLGVQYDYRSAFLAGIRRWTRRWFKSKLNDPSRLMCSEGVIRFLQNAGYPAVMSLDPEITTPKRLMKRLLRYPDQFALKYIRPGILERYQKGR